MRSASSATASERVTADFLNASEARGSSYRRSRPVRLREGASGAPWKQATPTSTVLRTSDARRPAGGEPPHAEGDPATMPTAAEPLAVVVERRRDAVAAAADTRACGGASGGA